ncbi:MAG TPA: cupin domain-containing protein [Solirubrobacterales bacterium]|nr:cupin domain-containing protein [Solirubrobacterales bacterium]
MTEYAVKRIDEMEAIYGKAFKRARAELGVNAFGMQVLDFPPNATQYPEHDHAEDGQEEVYVALRGSGEIEIEGERHRLDPETMVRVSPGVKRKIWTGDQELRLLAIGGVPGAGYEAPELTELGGLDPLAQGN